MIKNIMFDIDGTLMDSESVFYDSLKAALDFCGYDFPPEAYEGFFGKTGEDTAIALGISLSDTVFAQKWQDVFEEMSKAQPLFDGIPELFKTLYEKGIGVALITSRNHQSADLLTENEVYGKYLKGCIAAEDTEKHKPDPEPMLKACEVYGFSPDETVYIGDTANDFKAATAAGIKFAFAGWNKKAKTFGCETVLYSPEDALTCFFGQ